MTKDTSDSLSPETYGNFDSQVRVGTLLKSTPLLIFPRLPKEEGLDLKPVNHSHPPGS